MLNRRNFCTAIAGLFAFGRVTKPEMIKGSDAAKTIVWGGTVTSIVKQPVSTTSGNAILIDVPFNEPRYYSETAGTVTVFYPNGDRKTYKCRV